MTLELLVQWTVSALNPNNGVPSLALPRESAGWESFLDLARRHGLLPMIGRDLLLTHADDLPAPVFERIRGDLTEHLQRVSIHVGELLRLLSALEDQGIPALAWKGPALSFWAYGDVGSRPFADLDLLLRPSDALRARQVLSGCGYRPVQRLTLRQERTQRWFGEYQMVCPDPWTAVELRWQLLPFPFGDPLPMEVLFHRSREMTLEGRRIRVLGPEDILLTHAVHATKHECSRLLWLLDIVRIGKRLDESQWSAALKEAKHRGVRRMLEFPLRLVRELFPEALPKEIAGRLDRDPGVKAAGLQWFQEPPDPRGASGGIRWAGFCISMRERWLDRCRFLLRQIQIWLTPTEEEWNRVRLPDSLFLFYYLLRPVRLLGKYGSKLSRGAA